MDGACQSSGWVAVRGQQAVASAHWRRLTGAAAPFLHDFLHSFHSPISVIFILLLTKPTIKKSQLVQLKVEQRHSAPPHLSPALSPVKRVAPAARAAVAASKMHSSSALELDHQNFSPAEYFAGRIDAAWEEHKQSGNMALKAGALDQACHHYQVAAGIALGPFREGGTLGTFYSVLDEAPKDSPGWRIGQLTEIKQLIHNHLFHQYADMTSPPYYRPTPVDLPPQLQGLRQKAGLPGPTISQVY